MNAKLKILICFLIYYTQTLQSQQLYWNSGVSFNDKGNSQVIECVTDSSGNIYSIGFFKDSINVKGENLLSNGMQDVFVCKMDALYNIVWLKNFGGQYTDVPIGIEQQTNGNIIFAYNHAIPTTFIQKRHIKLFSLDAHSGSTLWQRQIGDSQVNARSALTLDKNDNIILGGEYYEKLILDSDTLTYTSNVSNAFIVKMDKSGNCTNYNKFKGVIIDKLDEQNNNVYIIGAFNFEGFFDSIILNYGSASGTISLQGYISKLDSNLKVIWAKTPSVVNIFGSGPTFASFGCTQIEVDKAENCYIVWGCNNIDFTYQSFHMFCQSSGGGDNIVMKIDSSGKFRWGKSLSILSGDDECNGISLNKEQTNLAVTGRYSSFLALGTDTLVAGISTARSYVAIMDSAGNFVNTIEFTDNDHFCRIEDVRYTLDSSIIVSGELYGSKVIGPDTLQYQDSSDAFIAKLKYTWPLSVPVVSHAAKDYTIYPNPSTGLVHITNAQGIKRISLINAMGSMVWQEVFKDPSQIITLELSNSLHKGLYYISIQDNSTTVNQKLVVE